MVVSSIDEGNGSYRKIPMTYRELLIYRISHADVSSTPFNFSSDRHRLNTYILIHLLCVRGNERHVYMFYVKVHHLCSFNKR